jgi:hypothetical protein
VIDVVLCSLSSSFLGLNACTQKTTVYVLSTYSGIPWILQSSTVDVVDVNLMKNWRSNQSAHCSKTMLNSVVYFDGFIYAKFFNTW